MTRNWLTIFRRRRRDSVPVNDLAPETLPRHVAIIMDGNGRWARSRGLPRPAGHHAGMGAMREVIRCSDDLGIQALTLYAFSTENWKRPRQEIQYLWHLVGEFFRTDMEELIERNVQVRFIGDTSKLPLQTQNFVRESIRLTAGNSGMIVQFALNYGSRAEIITAVRKLAEQVSDGVIKASEIDETVLSQLLETQGLPDPDLLIRTAGDVRISNFLLWQIAYAELYFTDLVWPEFTRTEYIRALQEYARRERRFGGLK
ncbi:MAG: isoprenyl transferase [Firmicutes bacterium]|nr:isoprenyl transferase [Bacillota bacterium]